MRRIVDNTYPFHLEVQELDTFCIIIRDKLETSSLLILPISIVAYATGLKYINIGT